MTAPENQIPLVAVSGLRLVPEPVVRGARRAITPIEITLERGETLFVLGDNSSGKTLLLDYLAGLLSPPPGTVFVRGLDMAGARERRRIREVVGIVFREAALMRSLTVEENVAMPMGQGAEVAKHVRNLLKLVGAAEVAEMPVTEISDGLGRCVSMARALAGNKRLLFCDEPTLGLSPGKAHQITELIQTLVERGILEGAVICTQDLDTAFRIGKKFLFLESSGDTPGHLAAAGTAEDLRAHPAFKRFVSRPPQTLHARAASSLSAQPS